MTDHVDQANEAFSNAIREGAEQFERVDGDRRKPPAHAARRIIYTRSLLKEARVWFNEIGVYSRKHNRGVLPQGNRGQKIVRWLADCTWEAYPHDPETRVRAEVLLFAPWLPPGELDALVVATRGRLKNWKGDHSATVLGITLADRDRLGFKALGACDDDGRVVRDERRRKKEAARKRAKRAENSSGRKPGRPRSQEQAWQIAGATSKATHYRNKARGTETETQNASAENLKNTSMRTEFKSHAPSAKPWDALGMSQRSYYRHKKAGTLPKPIEAPGASSVPARLPGIRPAFAIIRANAIDLDGVDFNLFGVVGIKVMSGNNLICEWRRPC